MRELVKLVTVDDVTPIDGADRIELAHIGGWQCVVKKGEFAPGATGVFFEIDSFLPAGDKRFEFLKARGTKTLNGKEGMRIRTIKLRKQLSQGLLLPTSEFSKKELKAKDIAAALDVTKYERPEPQHGGPNCVRLKNFPGFVQKTDQERVQNLTGQIKMRQMERFEITMKLDGSSMSVYHRDGETGVCSRNVDLPVYLDTRSWFEKAKGWLGVKLLSKDPYVPEVNTADKFVKMAHESKLLEVLATGAYGNIAIQGELVGPGIQGNREDLAQHRLFIFDIWDIDKQCYIRPTERQELVADILVATWHYEQKLRLVEHIDVLEENYELDTDVAGLLAMAEGPSSFNPIREGIVFKSLDSDFTFKAVSNKFLLKGGD